MTSGRDPRLTALAEIASLIKDRELGKVQRIAAHMNRLQADATQLRGAQETRAKDASIDAARLTGSEIAWRAWGDEHLRRTQAQLAALHVTHEAALASARKAFGRHSALTQLTKTGKRNDQSRS